MSELELWTRCSKAVLESDGEWYCYGHDHPTPPALLVRVSDGAVERMLPLLRETATEGFLFDPPDEYLRGLAHQLLAAAVGEEQ